MKTKFTLLVIFFVGFANFVNANNLKITSTSVAGQNITFNISWDNSWYANVAPNNWDAAWVFVKYQDCNTRLWNHAGVSVTAGDHSAASPLIVETVTDGKGVFLRRNTPGGGNITNASITLKMTIPAGTYNYKVFGIEMVSVPQGTFTLGGPGSESTKYNNITIDAATQSSGISAATLGGSSVTLPNTFPMGYNAFYCMKYEIFQLQYVDFLNTLTFPQQAARTAYDPQSNGGHAFGTQAASSYNNRNGIVVLTPGANAAIPAVYANDLSSGIENNNDDGQNIACNFISFMDVWAYLDWAALRPMTDMEYEKACRGPLPAVAGEYAWGSTNVTQVYNTMANLINDDTPIESFSTISNGRCAYGVGSGNVAYGPLRVGLFAESATGRESSGATYYGIMEMSGNLWERTVNTREAAGSAFTGALGDGTLNVNGDANVLNWPTTVGFALRGGDYYYGTTYCRISDRSNSQYNYPVNRDLNIGGRGVR
jgi:formylglycine-generating enzyme required for sulfatase activity